MSDLCKLTWCALIGLFRPRAALQAENLVLRHQLNVLRRKSPKRLVFGNVDRLVFTALYSCGSWSVGRTELGFRQGQGGTAQRACPAG
jgi:hypothetical protein